MLNTNLPAGNHVIKAVQYHAPSNQTKLTLCCGLVAWLSLLLTTQYKPEPGDYWIVTDHGTQSLIKKSMFDGYTKPKQASTPKFNLDSMFSVKMARPEDIARIAAVDLGAGDDITRLFLFDPQAFQLTSFADPLKFPFERQTAKPETLGMREENGWSSTVTKGTPAAGNTITTLSDAVRDVCAAMNGANEAAAQTNKQYEDECRKKTPTEVAAASATNMNHLLSNVDAQVWAKEFCSINKASDEGTMLSWFACAIMTGMDEANRRRDAEEAKLQNVIKSLTAQNTVKQQRINAFNAVVSKRLDVTDKLNKLIDVCADSKLLGPQDC